MNDICKNSAQIILTLLIFWLVSYGIVFSQSFCCSAISDNCIPAFNRIQTDTTLSVKCKASLSHTRSLTLLGTAESKILPKDVDAKSTCCESEPCDGFDLTTCYNNSSQQGSILRVKEFSSFHVTNGLQNTLNQKSQSIPPHPTSIYILTRSIIC
jgi:hypothetical protein